MHPNSATLLPRKYSDAKNPLEAFASWGLLIIFIHLLHVFVRTQ